MIRLFKQLLHYADTCQQDAGAPILILILFFAPLSADIKSKTGEIIIDTNSDGKSDIRINSTGLAIGDNLVPAANLHVSGNITATTGITIGDNVAGTSTLNIGGSLGIHTTTISDNTTLDSYGLVIVNSLAGDITVTLPDVITATGRIYTIKKLYTSNDVKINGAGNLIDLTDEYTLLADHTSYLSVISDGTQWFVIDQSDAGVDDVAFPIAGLDPVVWYDASDATRVLAGGSGNVYMWKDKSGNDFHFVQNTAANQPTTGTQTIGGLNAIDFNGTKFFSCSPGFTAAHFPANTGAWYAVVQVVSDTTYFVFENHNSSQWHRYNGNNKMYPSGLRNSRVEGIGSPTSNGLGIHCIITGTSNLKFFYNGSQNFSTSLPGNGYEYGDLQMGKPHWGNHWSNMRVGEFVYLPGDPSTLEREKVEGYLAHKWGTAGSLPGGHTYKNNPP